MQILRHVTAVLFLTAGSLGAAITISAGSSIGEAAVSLNSGLGTFDIRLSDGYRLSGYTLGGSGLQQCFDSSPTCSFMTPYYFGLNEVGDGDNNPLYNGMVFLHGPTLSARPSDISFGLTYLPFNFTADGFIQNPYLVLGPEQPCNLITRTDPARCSVSFAGSGVGVFGVQKTLIAGTSASYIRVTSVNVFFGVSSIPEPSTALLLIVPLVVGAVSRKYYQRG